MRTCRFRFLKVWGKGISQEKERRSPSILSPNLCCAVCVTGGSTYVLRPICGSALHCPVLPCGCCIVTASASSRCFVCPSFSLLLFALLSLQERQADAASTGQKLAAKPLAQLRWFDCVYIGHMSFLNMASCLADSRITYKCGN